MIAFLKKVWSYLIRTDMNLIPIKSFLFSFIYSTLIVIGHSCLVHCAQGKSRSVAIAISFIALSENISIDNALQNVQRYRKMADPNPGFIDQLHSFERNDVFKEFKNSDLVKNST